MSRLSNSNIPLISAPNPRSHSSGVPDCMATERRDSAAYRLLNSLERAIGSHVDDFELTLIQGMVGIVGRSATLLIFSSNLRCTQPACRLRHVCECLE